MGQYYNNNEDILHQSTSRPHIRILEEPANKIIRFRYKCEGRTAGSIPGENSKPDAKTFPTIMICNYEGPVHVVVSCVSVHFPHFQHPHQLVSKDESNNCRFGVYIKRLESDERRLELKLGIQCCKKLEVRDSLLQRQYRNIDPFYAGFEHMDDLSKINLYQLRLCYQAYVTVGKIRVALDPVVSAPIYGKSNELTINKISHCSSKMSGGDEIIMLCEKIAKNDIVIRFFETNDNGDQVWEDYAIFWPNIDVYKGTAIAFRTPRYHNSKIRHSVQVELQLFRPSDGATSDPLPFGYYPDPDGLERLNQKNLYQLSDAH